MLLKAIQCQVAPEFRSEFSNGQRAWAGVSELKGFMGQLGGWHEDTAWITCWWESWEDYSIFMEQRHDQLYEANGQKGAIQESSINFWESMPKAWIDRTRSLPLSQSSGRILIEILELSHGALPEFEDFLTWRWRPALASAPGLSQARMCRHRKLLGRYMSWSHWEENGNCIGLARMLQPGFSLPNRRLTLLKSLRQFVVPLEPSWTVEEVVQSQDPGSGN